MLATREDLLRDHPEFAGQILDACRKSIAYSDAHLDEVADRFVAKYGGDKQDILSSAGYPKIEFTFTDTERREAEAHHGDADRDRTAGGAGRPVHGVCFVTCRVLDAHPIAL